MRTYKSCAMSHDCPEYMLRNQYALVQKDGNKFFGAADRHKYSLPELKPIRIIRREAKFGLSQDSPYLTQHALVNSSTISTSLFGPMTPQKTISNSVGRIQPHIMLGDCIREARGNVNTLNKLLHAHTPVASPHRKIFTLLMRNSASNDQKIKQSLLNPFNARALYESIRHGPDSPYSHKMSAFVSTFSKAATGKANAFGKRQARNGFAAMLGTETPTSVHRNSASCY